MSRIFISTCRITISNISICFLKISMMLVHTFLHSAMRRRIFCSFLCLIISTLPMQFCLYSIRNLFSYKIALRFF
ncbi:putative membrane protein [Neisseria meningitidis NM36]|nr:putative membrane protein [Neisseria meningitidis NM36]